MPQGGERQVDATEQFQGLILSLGTAALAHLGAGQPSGQRTVDLQQAKQAIDLLEVLQERTKGNLTPEEERLLESVLFDLRMRFLAALEGLAPGSAAGTP